MASKSCLDPGIAVSLASFAHPSQPAASDGFSCNARVARRNHRRRTPRSHLPLDHRRHRPSSTLPVLFLSPQRRQTAHLLRRPKIASAAFRRDPPSYRSHRDRSRRIAREDPRFESHQRFSGLASHRARPGHSRRRSCEGRVTSALAFNRIFHTRDEKNVSGYYVTMAVEKKLVSLSSLVFARFARIQARMFGMSTPAWRRCLAER